MVPPRGHINYSVHTEKTYIYWTKHFVLYHNERRPLEMREGEINGFLTYLAVEGTVANAVPVHFGRLSRRQVHNVTCGSAERPERNGRGATPVGAVD